MSINVNWEKLKQDEQLAESVRSFIHDRFQQVQLPRFIRSVKAHSFEFGSVAPQVEVKDVCDPLPDFYDSDEEGDGSDAETGDRRDPTIPEHLTPHNGKQQVSGRPVRDDNITDRGDSAGRPKPHSLNTDVQSARPANRSIDSPNPFSNLQGPKTGIPGGTSNMSYFHLPLGAGLSGSSTPLGGSASRFGGSLLDHLHNSNAANYERTSISPPAELPTAGDDPTFPGSPSAEHSANDLQIVTHLKYDGDIRLSLTAEVFFDYPMQSFVGIPLQLNVTGIRFDGVAILAYIKHKAHFCFLAPEDADALVGGEEANELANKTEEGVDADMASQEGESRDGNNVGSDRERKAIGRLFEEIRVESEIGERERGKQVLKNIGKVEKFVLDQVRRIFESELVYPSFWTFLV